MTNKSILYNLKKAIFLFPTPIRNDYICIQILVLYNKLQANENFLQLVKTIYQNRLDF